jgi:purine-binding chemotaxis protein CheW
METIASTEEVLQLVTFTLNDEEYAVDILSVQEINRITEITQVPNSPDYVDGVINLRGKVIPVINMRQKFGLSDKASDDTSRVIIMDIQGVTNGLLVDSVSEVLRISSNIVEPPPALSSATHSKFIKGIAKMENRLIVLIDINKLMGGAVEL